jgi:hypothetical protein
MRVLSVALGAVIAACASGGAVGSTMASAGPIEGAYEFSASILGIATGGKLIVQEHDVFLADGEKCVIASVDSIMVGVSCGRGPIASSAQTWVNAMLFLHRRNPASGGKWITTIPVTRRREVCERYERNRETSRTRCVARRIESHITYETRSGSVRVRRVP